jgi:hypothetical protein
MGFFDETALTNPLYVEAAAPTDSLYIDTNGNTGLGTEFPEEKLHVKDGNFKVEQTAQGVSGELRFATTDSLWVIKQNGVTGRLTFSSPGGGAITAPFKFDRQATENLFRVGVVAANVVDINGTLRINGSNITPDYVFAPGYPLESIEEHAEFMWKHQHLPGLPGADANKDGVDIVSHQFGTLEELEKAHIYISQLNNEIHRLRNEHEARIAKLEAALKLALDNKISVEGSDQGSRFTKKPGN